MASHSGKKGSGKGQKGRVQFRRNRSARRRTKDWTGKAQEAEDAARIERVVAKGDLSRGRTVTHHVDEEPAEGLRRGVVMNVRGLYADVDDGQRIWPCTVRRVLRTRRIEERSAVTVGDRVHFSVGEESAGVVQEGAIEHVEPRGGMLQRLAGRRVQTIVANVDQAIIVSSAAEPRPKPHLIDRYIVATHFGGMQPIIVMNKIDLDCGMTSDEATRPGGQAARRSDEAGDSPETDNSDDAGYSAASILDRYTALGYIAFCTSAATGEGIDTLREVLKGKSSAIAGQSGVGKSSLLNAVQPGLDLKVGEVTEQTGKGRHTTTTAHLIRLEVGGYVVDTPGIRSFDVTIVPQGEIEAYFVEFVDRVKDCKFKGCTHTHETGCAIKAAVERGEIDIDRYATYVELFEEAAPRR
jgi:ribosome biogenesis GTPase